AARAAGEEHHATKSHHHQGVDELGEGLIITGTSTLDDLPEAVEIPSSRFVLGVQWHPEADEKSRVIGALIEQARDYRDSRPAGAPATRAAAPPASRAGERRRRAAPRRRSRPTKSRRWFRPGDAAIVPRAAQRRRPPRRPPPRASRARAA